MEDPPDFRRRLVDAIKAIEKTGAAKIVRQRGPPISNPFFWPDPQLYEVEVELFSLVIDGLRAKWSIDDRSIQRFTRQLLWESLCDPSKEGQVEEAVDSFLKKATVKLTNFNALVAVDGIHPAMSSMKMGAVVIGLLDDLVDEKTAREMLVRSEGKVTMWAQIQVEAPSMELVADAAAQEVEEALDMLATLGHRSRAFKGHPGEIRLGSIGFASSEGEWKQFGFRNEWHKGQGYYVDPNTAQNNPHLRYKAGPFPWEMLPPDSELAKALKEAYRRFGHATRLSHDPEAAIPLAVSSIESLLSDRHDKQYATAARIMLASVASNQPVIWPPALIGWFEERHDILHRPSQVRWTEKEASEAFWSLYGVLDQISNFVVSGKIIRRDDLISHLMTPTNIEQAKKAVEVEVQKLKELQAKAVTSEYRTDIERGVKTWESISKRLLHH